MKIVGLIEHTVESLKGILLDANNTQSLGMSTFIY